MSKRAFLVGCNYTGTNNQLNGCINDVMSMYNFLLTQGYTKENILTLTDNTVTKPTRANILKGFAWLLSGAINSDISKSVDEWPESKAQQITFHYSGHGTYLPDTDGDEVTGRDDQIVPLDFEQNGFISDDVVREQLVNKVPQGVNLTGIIDCCYSGTEFDLRWTINNDNKGQLILNKNNAYPDTVGSVVCLSGSLDTQLSNETAFRGREEGVLTYYFITIMSQNKNPTNEDLLNNLRTLIDNDGINNQTPTLSFGKATSLKSTFPI